MDHEVKKTGLLRWRLRTNVAMCLISCLFSSQFALSQGKGTGNLSGIRCDHDRAETLGINFANNVGVLARSPSVLTALDQSGVGWSRIAIQWGWIERKQGVYNWENIDAAINKSLSVHVRPLVTIMGPIPCWALDHPQQGCDMPQHQLPKKEAWSKFTSVVVSRYKDRVHSWEIWNEPNLTQTLDIPDLDQRLTGYREQILLPGAEAVHAADPSAEVVAPTLALTSASNAVLDHAIKLVLKPPANQLIDVVSFHAYFPGDIKGKAMEIRGAMRSLGIGAKPIWLTETGLGTEGLGVQRFAGTSYMESRQVDFLKADVLNALASGTIQKVFWFAMTDSHDRNGTHIDHYGLVDESGPQLRVRPAFLEIQRVVQAACQLHGQ